MTGIPSVNGAVQAMLAVSKVLDSGERKSTTLSGGLGASVLISVAVLREKAPELGLGLGLGLGLRLYMPEIPVSAHIWIG